MKAITHAPGSSRIPGQSPKDLLGVVKAGTVLLPGSLARPTPSAFPVDAYGKLEVKPPAFSAAGKRVFLGRPSKG